MAEQQSGTLERPLADCTLQEEDEYKGLPRMHPLIEFAAWLEQELQIEASLAYEIAHELSQLESEADAAHPCLVAVFDMVQLKARAAVADLTLTAALETLDRTFSSCGARVETFVSTEEEKTTKLYFFRTFQEYQTAHDEMKFNKPGLQWAFTSSKSRHIELVASGALPPEVAAPLPITCTDLLFMKLDNDVDIGDCAKVGFFKKH